MGMIITVASISNNTKLHSRVSGFPIITAIEFIPEEALGKTLEVSDEGANSAVITLPGVTNMLWR